MDGSGASSEPSKAGNKKQNNEDDYSPNATTSAKRKIVDKVRLILSKCDQNLLDLNMLAPASRAAFEIDRDTHIAPTHIIYSPMRPAGCYCKISHGSTQSLL